MSIFGRFIASNFIFFFSFFIYAQNKLLVILNTKEGGGKAEKIYEEKIKKKLEEHYDLEVFKANRGKKA